MPDPSIVRFRRVISSAYAHLEARRQEVNDLNVFPVADGDTGDNMAMTMRAVMEELDHLDDLEVDEVGRTQLVQALARAALMGARGNSGVILSQIVRGAAEELASRPGELIDPVLVASAFASAADAAYDSVREPAEGTMLTVFREMAHSIARQLAHLDAEKQRLDRGVSDAEQDAVLAEVLERAIADGQRAVERTPEQLDVLRESGVVDAGGYGLVDAELHCVGVGTCRRKRRRHRIEPIFADCILRRAYVNRGSAQPLRRTIGHAHLCLRALLKEQRRLARAIAVALHRSLDNLNSTASKVDDDTAGILDHDHVGYAAGVTPTAVHAALQLPLDVCRYPAQLLRDAADRTTWILDEGAAARLPGVPPSTGACERRPRPAPLTP